ncbi:T9SS type A sorting domain-containing protein [Prevotella dentasini]|uniref:T9SS type A sorting domain-containing protein n=1 Tax=Prevotella dentasini TaxID=589537 RepID=UPI000B10E979|nr:T9SS type A sorting domain-containing protein [Prevotella dentasini]
MWKLSTIKNLQFVGLTDGIGQLTRQETGKLTISLRENLLTVHGIGSQPALATIYDISGQIVLRAKVADGESIDASALSNGIFIIRVNNKTLKFVKQ